MNNINPTLKEALAGNYRFNFENYISRGFDITGKYTGGYMGYTFLYFLIIMIVGSIPQIGDYVNSLLVLPILTAGFYIVAKQISFNEGYDFEGFFDGFKDIGNLMIVALIPFAITTLLGLAIGGSANFWGETFAENFSNVEDFSELDLSVLFASLSIGVLIVAIPMIYLTIAWSFAPHFVVFYKMPAWEAMETSRKLVNKKWFSFFGFAIVQGLIVLLGMLLICVGVLYFLPAAYNASYVAFEDITKFHEEIEEDDILDYLVEN